VTMKARWLARLSFVLMLAAVAVLIGFAELGGLVMIVIGVIGAVLVVGGIYTFLARRGVLRWIAAAVVVLTPVAILVLFALHNLIWVALVSVALIVLAAGAGRRALTPAAANPGMPAREVAPPKRAFLIMNPRSGGGKVTKFSLKEKAEALGAQVALLEGPGVVDVAALARQAVADGADLLGVAGGDGTQALVAGIAAEHDLPFLVISAGTRNHFAMDLGLDRENPAACLDALTDGMEQRIDLGVIGDRTFVNNASFGAYAEIVESPAYRDDKAGTTLEMLPGILNGHRGATLSATAGDTTITGPQALLVSNNPYEGGDIAGLSRRSRLDAGTLGIVAVTVNSALQAATLLRGARGQGLTTLTAEDVVVDAEVPEIPVGIDGETVKMATPVSCTIQPKALRVRVPRNRPGVPAPRAALDWPKLRHLASFRPLTLASPPGDGASAPG
jgi:diacylglycerol kinase family enzyme